MPFPYPNRRSSPALLLPVGMFAVAGLLLVSAAVLSLAGTARAESHSAWQAAGDGKAIFDKNCAGCHSIGGGKLVGPDLQGVTQRRDVQWIKDFISDPKKMVASDPTAQALLKEYNNLLMPTIPLTPEELDQLVAYLGNPGAAPAAPPPAVPAGAGNPQIGERIFLGEQRLANNGPACIACHTVGGSGWLGGGALGPDLTHVVQRLGQPGLAASLNNIVFPTMLGPYQNRPLTPQEQADLIAFLQNADRQQPPVTAVLPGAVSANTLRFFGLALAGAVALFGLLFFIWRRQRRRHRLHLPAREI